MQKNIFRIWMPNHSRAANYHYLIYLKSRYARSLLLARAHLSSISNKQHR